MKTQVLDGTSVLFDYFEFSFGEFDSGSERTLAAWIRHASRTRCCTFDLRKVGAVESGGRASNAWASCPQVGDNPPKGELIPDVFSQGILGRIKVGILRNLPLEEAPACHQLVGEVTAHQGLRLAGLRGWPAALGLRHCPDSYGRLQSRIIRNARKCDDATQRGG